MPKSAGPPSPFYRVSVKAIILDGDRMLLSKDKNGEWETPGGGWEHGETLELALTRELQEELHAEVAAIGQVKFVWRDYSATRDVHYLRIAVPVTLKTHDLQPDDGDLIEARFVTRDELLQLPFQDAEEGIKECVDMIWRG